MATVEERVELAKNLQLAWRAWLRNNRIETEARKNPIEYPEPEFMKLAEAFIKTHRANSKATIEAVSQSVKSLSND